jgi:hypothetical protein
VVTSIEMSATSMKEKTIKQRRLLEPQLILVENPSSRQAIILTLFILSVLACKNLTLWKKMLDFTASYGGPRVCRLAEISTQQANQLFRGVGKR